jgi:5'-phosphate synthase pdxT subunit
MRIGVLALQGDFALHTRALSRVRADEAVESVEVRKPGQLDGLDGLVIPGGESTTLLKLMEAFDFWPALRAFHAAGRPIFGTCAGAILVAREVENPSQPSLGFIDIGVERNAYGRQRESFVADGEAELHEAGRLASSEPPTRLEMVFIRAPRIRRVGPGVRVLARHKDEPVMVREGDVLVATFHPELTDDPTVHTYFVAMAARRA